MANEKRLIDAYVFYKKFANDTPTIKVGEQRYVPTWRISDLIGDAPTVDAVEVVHGRWENNHCTVCGMTPLGEELWDHLDIEPPRFELCMDYCPCCGAKMDGDGNA